MRRLCITFLVLCSVAVCAQPKLPIKPRLLTFDYDSCRAAYTWLNAWESSIPDTAIDLFIKYSTVWQDTVFAGPYARIEFRFDSVRGRGAARQVLLTKIMKKRDSTDWIWTRYDCYDTTGWAARTVYDYDSTGKIIGSHTTVNYDTLMRRTPDSTLRASNWYGHVQNDYWNQIVTGLMDAGLVGGYSIEDTLGNKRMLEYRLEKVIGDPTVNNGWNQKARLHFTYRELEPKWFRQKFMHWDPTWDSSGN